MIYVTGDTHADIMRFKSREAKRLKLDDTLIVCGDFGFVWDGSQKEQRLIKWLGKLPYNVLFVEGTHDNLDLLAQYPRVAYSGGTARQLSGHCHQLLRGEIYKIEDSSIFTFGGGESGDADTRMRGQTWWPEEQPSNEEMAYATENLRQFGGAVDYVVTHEATAQVNSFLHLESLYINPLGAFFDGVSRSIRFRRWFFGCYHLDKVIPPNYQAMHRAILPMNDRR